MSSHRGLCLGREQRALPAAHWFGGITHDFSIWRFCTDPRSVQRLKFDTLNVHHGLSVASREMSD
jgi:hypothetical protein